MVVAEVELADVPLQMRLGNVMVRADNASLEDREIVFDRVGVRAAANVFLD